MEKISLSQFDEVYKLFEESFVLCELRPYEQMKELFKQGMFCIYVKYMQDTLLGAMIVWPFSSFVYIENFAVNSKARGQGIGGMMIEEIKKEYDCLFVLEVEKPFDELSKRRVSFYQKHDYIFNDFNYLQPPLRQEHQDVDLYVMSYPQRICDKQFHQIKQQIFQTVYQ